MTSPSLHNPSTHFACCWVICKPPSCRVGNLSNPPQNWLGKVQCGLYVAACPCTSHHHVSCAHKLYLQPIALVQRHCWEDKAQCNGICWTTVASVSRTNICFIRDIKILKDNITVRFDILTVMLLRIQVFLDVTLCHQMNGSQCSERPCMWHRVAGRVVPNILHGHVNLHSQCQAVHEEIFLACGTVSHPTWLESPIKWLQCTVVQHAVTSQYSD